MKKKMLDKIMYDRIILPKNYFVTINEDGTKWQVDYIFNEKEYIIMSNKTNKLSELLSFIKKNKKLDFFLIFHKVMLIIYVLLLILFLLNLHDSLLISFLFGVILINTIVNIIDFVITCHKSKSIEFEIMIRSKIVKGECQSLIKEIEKEIGEEVANYD